MMERKGAKKEKERKVEREGDDREPIADQGCFWFPHYQAVLLQKQGQFLQICAVGSVESSLTRVKFN
ncbi:hypothetical protein LSTR_LSTR006934 [Laodelphax striatellus]|uniref:Uncharacterized protein n=1 Tax=Laodelphax striatellus TaxID=195883 RepID=A0A482X347_LAOST|nr:hypothetical protein LSTR_LSTR006934 [Laodelphax striatellus]